MPDGGLHFPAFVLNADFRPLSNSPLSTWNWQDAVKAVFLDRVSVLSEYDREVRSPSFSMRLPSVIALRDFIPSARTPAFTRFNVFLRDGFTCQYCDYKRPAPELTFGHVFPRAHGGRTSWENLGLASSILFVLVQRLRNTIYRQTVSSNSIFSASRQSCTIPGNSRRRATMLSVGGEG
jgi:hypothetical protein